MEGTAPVKRGKRKAREERFIDDLQALEDFANLGDTSEDWQRFRLKWPHFFPDYLTQWIYDSAKYWKIMSNLPERPPHNYRELVPREFGVNPDVVPSEENWAEMAHYFRSELRDVRPSLIYFRILLRLVWSKQDPDDKCLSCLLGFDADPPDEEVDGAEGEVNGLFWFGERPKTAAEIEEEETDNLKGPPGIPMSMWRRHWESFGGLPAGRPVADGGTGNMVFQFGCQFQSAIYDLMKDRWRAKVCSWSKCRKYFIADKRGRKYCSEKCCWDKKLEHALVYYHRKGKFARQAKALRGKSQRKESTGWA